MHALSDLASSQEFQWGVVWGVIATASVAVVSVVTAGRAAALRHAGVAVAMAACVALAQTAGLPWQTSAGAVALGAGAIVGDRVHLLARPLLLLPGALLLASGPGIHAPWARVLVVAAAVAASAATGTERRWPAATPALLAIAAGGVYLTVPDTEHARALVGALGPMVFLGWPLVLARVGSGGTAAMAGLIAWTAAVDGTGRPGAIVGGTACLGLLLAEPAARALARRAARLPPVGSIVAQVALVLLASRVAGLRRGAGEAFVIAAVALAVAAAVLVAVSPRPPPGNRG